MKRPPVPALAAGLVVLSATLAACGRDEIPPPEPEVSQPAFEGRESIHDRVVTIEPDLITEIPAVGRFCDELGLTQRRVNVGDAELFVEEEGEGMPLVLINGGPGGTHHYFHPWFGRAAGYARVIYYDQRGCGLSDFEPGEDGYSVEQAVDDLDALRQALGIDKWVVLGYSYGGFLAQLYTVSHPDNVAGLVLVGASPATGGDLGPSRQRDFLSEEEVSRRDEIRRQLQELSDDTDMSAREYTQLLVYNNFINGDWKRQNFYKPSPERMARMALYEWDHADNFNGTMGETMSGIDLAGAFDRSPIPTLILEGKWDLTWAEGKAGFLQENHPHATLVVFESAGHGIYDEEPDSFFSVLEDFVRDLPAIPAQAIEGYKDGLPDWKAQRAAAPTYALRDAGWGWNSSRKLAAEYTRDWLAEFDEERSFLRLGFALYDVEDYDEARFVFERMEGFAAEAGRSEYAALALIWQGHMLDLLGNRDAAIRMYRRVVDMNLEDTWSHGQYGLEYSLSPYARERMAGPFERIDNRDSS